MPDDYDDVDRLIDTDPIELGRRFRQLRAERDDLREALRERVSEEEWMERWA